MFEADSLLKLLLTPILDIYRELEHIGYAFQRHTVACKPSHPSQGGSPKGTEQE
jgi:hypothetical protein